MRDLVFSRIFLFVLRLLVRDGAAQIEDAVFDHANIAVVGGGNFQPDEPAGETVGIDLHHHRLLRLFLLGSSFFVFALFFLSTVLLLLLLLLGLAHFITARA